MKKFPENERFIRSFYMQNRKGFTNLRTKYVPSIDPHMYLMNEAEEIQETYNTSAWSADEIADFALKRIDHSIKLAFAGDDVPFIQKMITIPASQFIQDFQDRKRYAVINVICLVLGLLFVGLCVLVITAPDGNEALKENLKTQ